MTKPVPAKTKYAAFLRGINVGGNNPVPMAELKKLFEKIGFSQVKTLLASGNVVFETAELDAGRLREIITAAIERKFGFKIGIIIRTLAHLEKMIAAEPFQGIAITPEVRLYVTFLSDKPASKMKIPYESPSKEFRILKVTAGEIFSFLWVDRGGHTIEAMNVIEKEFGKNVTTRNWNTINKLVAK